MAGVREEERIELAGGEVAVCRCNTTNDSEDGSDHGNDQLKGLDDVKITSLTIHGFPRAIESKSWIARVFWMVLFFVGFGFFVNFANQALTHFLQHDTYQKVTIEPRKKVSFPSVTICNMRAVYARLNKEHVVSDKFHNTPSQGVNHYFNHHRKMYNDLDFDQFSNGYNKIVNTTDSKFCNFGGKLFTCNASMFKTVSLIPGCLTFNPDGNLYQKQSGRAFGLQMLLYVNSSVEKVEIDPHFSGNEQDDIAVLIHEPGVYPDIALRPIFLETGQHTKVAIRKKISNLLPAPAPSKCVNSMEGLNFKMFPGKYVTSLCSESCHLFGAYSECGDVPEWFRLIFGAGALPTLKMSNIDQKACLEKHTDDYKIRQDESKCICPPSCNSVNFENMITTSKWPAISKKESVSNYLTGVLGAEIEAANLSIDFAYLSVFYDDFLINVEKEVRVYNTFSLLSDLGGQAGLYLGASFFSIVELALVLFFYLLGVIKKHVNEFNARRN